jgi:hypothetical protein
VAKLKLGGLANLGAQCWATPGTRWILNMIQTHTTRINFEVCEQVEIKPGIFLPPGTYPGVRVETYLETHQGPSSIGKGPKYMLELTVTKFIDSGEITVRQ